MGEQRLIRFRGIPVFAAWREAAGPGAWRCGSTMGHARPPVCVRTAACVRAWKPLLRVMRPGVPREAAGSGTETIAPSPARQYAGRGSRSRTPLQSRPAEMADGVDSARIRTILSSRFSRAALLPPHRLRRKYRA